MPPGDESLTRIATFGNCCPALSCPQSAAFSDDCVGGVLATLVERGRATSEVVSWVVRSARRKLPKAATARYVTRKATAIASRPAKIRAYFAEERPFAGLQLGCGPHHLDGWLPTDLAPQDLGTAVYLDATRTFPFPDGKFDFIVAEQMIEHLRFAAAMRMLRECHRVLRAGGTLRVSTMDVHLARVLLTEPLSDLLRRYVVWSNTEWEPSCDPDSAVHVFNRMNHEWGHQFLYDAPTLIRAFERCGFTNVTECQLGKSDHPELLNTDRHGEVSGEYYDMEVLIVEGTK
jgi:predicted SAM-dependent methyltransferase